MVHIHGLIKQHIGTAGIWRISIKVRNVGLGNHIHSVVVKQNPALSNLDNGYIMPLVESTADVHHDPKQFVVAVGIIGLLRRVE